MVEGTPGWYFALWKTPKISPDTFKFVLGVPYEGSVSEFNKVEANMKKRRHEVQALLGPDEQVFSMSCCPR